MPLMLIDRRGKRCPVPVCDVCQLPIQRAEDGNYEWAGEERRAVAYFSHKHCSTRLRAQHPDVDSWTSLGALPVFLAANLGLTWADAEEIAAFHEE